ncbi:MAG: serine hydroxymethyltransferase, partial [Stellaceae bacterium]
KLFNAEHVNVQASSGSQANMAATLAVLEPGQTLLGMDLACGGHLTHGMRLNYSGKLFKVASYPVRKDNFRLDYDQIMSIAKESRPRLIICGASAYPRIIDFAAFRRIADEVGAILMADIAHIAGLVVGGVHPSPFPHADIVTTTTHKTLRGPRGGMILANDPEIGRRINAAVFPGLQGGPLMHVIAAKAVALHEALQPEFRRYAAAVVANAQALAAILAKAGLAIVSGGTDSHLFLVDLRPLGLTGRAAEASLERAGITCNKNAIPFDPEKPTVTSGIRLGTAAVTARGFGLPEIEILGRAIIAVLRGLAEQPAECAAAEARVREEIGALCARFPIYDEAV